MSPRFIEVLQQQLYLNTTLLIEEDKIRDKWEENIKTYLENIKHYNSMYEKSLCYDNLNHCYVMHNTYMKLYENAIQANYETVASILDIIKRCKIIKQLLDLYSKIDYEILQKHEHA